MLLDCEEFLLNEENREKYKSFIKKYEGDPSSLTSVKYNALGSVFEDVPRLLWNMG